MAESEEGYAMLRDCELSGGADCPLMADEDVLSRMEEILADAFLDILGSSNISWNLPLDRSEIDETALGYLRSFFGVKTISGFLNGLTTCLLKMWNI